MPALDPHVWASDDPITADRLNEIRDALIHVLRGDHGIEVKVTAGKVVIDAAGAPARSVGGVSDIPSQPFLWKNQGGTAMAAGHVLVPDKAAQATGKDGDALALERPTKDNDISVVWINRSPNVIAGGTGGCELAGVWPFLARVNKAVEVQNSVGIAEDTSTFVLDMPGFRVLAYEGNRYSADPAEFWAWLSRGVAPDVTIVTTGSPAADEITAKTIDEDGALGEKEFNLFVPEV